MKETLQGTLQDYCAAQNVAQDLMEIGVTLDDIRLVPNHSTLPSFETGDFREGTTIRASVVGAIVGAAIGLYMAFLLFPGFGAAAAGVWLLSILIGIFLGGVAGSICGALWEYIVEETEAARLADRHSQSVTLLARVAPKLESRVKQVLINDGAEHVYVSPLSWSLMIR